MNINSKAYSFTSISLMANGVNYSGISEVNYSDTVSRTKIKGTGVLPIGRTEGDYEAEGSITFYKSEYDRFARNNPNIFDVTFDVSITYSNGTDVPVTDVLRACKIESLENSNSEGSDATTVSATLNLMWIERNGVKPFDRSNISLSLSVSASAAALLTAGF